ncbi:MAG TPA: MBL fold metallo-hydrolase [Candidatus Limnocylindria bacterium]|nr:MBL fold metallo-hydrolase [Candidatus Limnocylindria bacterium]
MRRALAVLGIVLLVGAGYFGWRLHDRPSLGAVPVLAAGATGAPAVTVRFLGVSSLAISDGTTTLVTDGFVSRPGLLRTIAGRIAPDPATIDWALERAGLRRAAAVLTVHSHYDHAMDAPLVAERLGALLVGSESTANVARGVRFPEERIRIVTPGAPMPFGVFEVTLLESRHFPHGMAMGAITEPLVPPARATAYREGGSYSILVAHPLGTLLVQGSAGWKEGALAGRRAEVVFLGVGALGTKDDAYTERYLREVVDAVGARLVVPIHWDDFTRPLGEPLVPMPRLLDDAGLTMERLARHLTPRGVRIALPPAFEPVAVLPLRP